MSKHTKDSSQQTTKQMLDELDALMERMLALPVSQPDAVAPFPKSVVKGPTLAATLTLLERSPAPNPTPATVPVTAPPTDSQGWHDHPILNPPHFTQAGQESLTAPEPSDQPVPLTNAVLPPSALARMEPLLAGLPDLSMPKVTGWFYLPLVWLNELFDGVTSIAWGTGWIRMAGGRRFLGFSGIALFLIALGWALVDWRGWNW
ncbi:MAG: hypothetical protein EXS16_15595 [Gemmataceae bacterium]|nr:hypothetical protein [Gemmataceae bacterium]